jgi:anaerobic selenocysteine-containing dehydrogenase
MELPEVTWGGVSTVIQVVAGTVAAGVIAAIGSDVWKLIKRKAKYFRRRTEVTCPHCVVHLF